MKPAPELSPRRAAADVLRRTREEDAAWRAQYAGLDVRVVRLLERETPRQRKALDALHLEAVTLDAQYAAELARIAPRYEAAIPKARALTADRFAAWLAAAAAEDRLQQEANAATEGLAAARELLAEVLRTSAPEALSALGAELNARHLASARATADRAPSDARAAALAELDERAAAVRAELDAAALLPELDAAALARLGKLVDRLPAVPPPAPEPADPEETLDRRYQGIG